MKSKHAFPFLNITNYFLQQIRVDGELMLDNGRIILESKTDFSYSNDARKTVTLFSKVKDISEYNSNNYSVEMGLKHPYTNIDVNLKSTLGSSDQKMTAGFEASYLTASRQTKNLQLLSEINKLKKQISLQVRAQVFSEISLYSLFRVYVFALMFEEYIVCVFSNRCFIYV